MLNIHKCIVILVYCVVLVNVVIKLCIILFHVKSASFDFVVHSIQKFKTPKTITYDYIHFRNMRKYFDNHKNVVP